MTRCQLCKDYPEGTACAVPDCPGRAFRHISGSAQRPDDLDAWLDSINADLLREVEAAEAKQSGTVSFHIGGISK
jgi:hypothetical protein